jgi:hypothetical protein
MIGMVKNNKINNKQNNKKKLKTKKNKNFIFILYFLKKERKYGFGAAGSHPLGGGWPASHPQRLPVPPLGWPTGYPGPWGWPSATPQPLGVISGWRTATPFPYFS